MAQTKRNTSIAGCSFELALATGQAPTDVHLLPAGSFRSVDGRPDDVATGAWHINAAVAADVIALAKSRKTDILIDFEHQSLNAKTNGKRVEAAGWIPRTLEWREGAGLFAVGVQWVGDTADLIVEKKVRYISPVFLYDKDNGDVLEVISVAITNTPGLDDLEALADLARAYSIFPTEEEADMPDKEVVALTVERDGLQTKVASLTAERDTLNTSVAALTKERDDFKAKAEKLEGEKAEATKLDDQQKHSALLVAALNDGRLVPAQKSWAEKQSLVALTEYLEATDPISIAKGKQHQENNQGGHGLSQEALAWCTRMDVSPEEYLAAKKSQG